MISLRHNFLYVHIPKTAGNTLQGVLNEYSEDRLVCIESHQDGIERFEVRNDRFRIEKHSTLREYQRELGTALLAELFKFTCVRNPWERAISYYFSPHRGVTAWDREAFVACLNEMRPANEFVELDGDLAGASPFSNVDFVMRFEQLAEDFRIVCSRIGIPARPLPVRNKSDREHFTRYYDSELVDLIGRRFAPEIRYFGYAFQ